MSEIPPSESTSTTQTDGRNLSPEDQCLFLKDEPGKKRARTLLTQEQTEILHRILAKTAFPSTSVREAAAQQLGISPRKVQVWFQNVRQKHKRLGGNLLKGARRYHSTLGSQMTIAAKPPTSRSLRSPNSEDMHQNEDEAAELHNRSSSARNFRSSERHRQQYHQRSTAGSIDSREVHAEELEGRRLDHLEFTLSPRDRLALQSPPTAAVDLRRNSEDTRLPTLASPDLLTQHRTQSERRHVAVSSDPLSVPTERSRRVDLERSLTTALRPSQSHLSAFSFPPPHPQVRRSHEAPPRSRTPRLDVSATTRPRAGTLAYGSLRGRRAFDLVRSGLPLQHPSACLPLHRHSESSSDHLARGSWSTPDRHQHNAPYEHRRPSGSLSRSAQPEGLSPSALQVLSRRRDLMEMASRGQRQPGRPSGSPPSRGSTRSSLPSIQAITSSIRRRSDISEDLVRPAFAQMQSSDRCQSAHLQRNSSPFSSMTARGRQGSNGRVSPYRGESTGSALSLSSLTSGMHTMEGSLSSLICTSPRVESPQEGQSTSDATGPGTLSQRPLDMEELQHALSDIPQPIEIELGSAKKAATMAYGHRHAASSYRLAEGTDGFSGHTRSPSGSFSGLTDATKMRASERGQAGSHDHHHSPYSFAARSPSMSPPHHSAFGSRSRSMSLLSLEEEDALTLPPILSLLASAGPEDPTAGKAWHELGEHNGEGRGGQAAQVCKLPGIAHLISPRSL